MKADGIEFDVHLSRDRVPVIIHDEELERTTNGKGLVRDYNLDQLKKLDAGSWFDSAYVKEKIPTLDEVFTHYQNSNLLFNIELKNSLTANPGIEGIVINCIVKYSLEKRVIISSFNHDSLQICRQINSKIRTGLLYLEEVEEPWLYARKLDCYSVHPLFFYLQNPELLAGFEEHNIPLYPWTVNDPEQMKKLVNAGVEGIITDYPQLLKKILMEVIDENF